MFRDLRGIALVAVITIIAVVLISIPRINVSVFGWEFARGDDGTFLGLSLGLDLEGGAHLVYDIRNEDGSAPSAEDVEAIRTIVERRVNEFGVSEPTVQLLGSPPDRILIQIPGQSASSLTVAFDGSGPTADELRDFFATDLGKVGVDVSVGEDEAMTVRFDEFDGSMSDEWRQQAEQKFVTQFTVAFEYDVVEPGTATAGDESVAAADATPAADADGTPSAGDGTATAESDAAETPESTATPEPTATPSPEPSPTADDAADGTPEADATATTDETPTAGDADSGTTEGEADPNEPERIGPSQEDVQAAFNAAGFDSVMINEGQDTVLFQQSTPGQFASVDAVSYQGEYNGRLVERSFDDAGDIVPSDVERLRRELVAIGNLAQFRTEGNISQWTVAGGIQEAKALIGSTAKLEFRERTCGSLTAPNDYEGESWPPDGLSESEWLLLRCSDPQYFTERATNISAGDLIDAFPSVDGTPPQPVVTIVFNDAGRDAFFEVTGRVARNRDVLAIYLDDVELVAPTVNTTTGEGIPDGRAIISGGDFTNERVRTLSIQLRSGALPADLVLTEERNVDAILGADSLRRSLIAGGIGLALLIVFMIAYYKVPGIVSSVALVAYAIMLLGAFKLVPVTLTLSGAAAVILSLGFAVDANILIAERTKEELRAGRGLLAAINSGFDRAWPSIRDGNLSTIIVAIVLFWFGDRFSTSIMQGFALTLGIGVLLSMFTAFFASRLMLRLIARTGIGTNLDLFVPVRDARTQIVATAASDES